MEESRGRAGNTTVIVTLITVLGAIATGVITNWEKIFGSGAPAPAPPIVMPTKADPAPAANTVADQAPAAAAPASERAGLAASDEAAQTSTASTSHIAGDWAEPGGTVIRIAQQGNEFAYRQFANGIWVGDGGGEIHGRALTYQFRFTNGQVMIGGRCEATVQAANLIVGNCYPINAPAFPFQMAR